MYQSNAAESSRSWERSRANRNHRALARNLKFLFAEHPEVGRGAFYTEEFIGSKRSITNIDIVYIGQIENSFFSSSRNTPRRCHSSASVSRCLLPRLFSARPAPLYWRRRRPQAARRLLNADQALRELEHGCLSVDWFAESGRRTEVGLQLRMEQALPRFAIPDCFQ